MDVINVPSHRVPSYVLAPGSKNKVNANEFRKWAFRCLHDAKDLIMKDSVADQADQT